MFEIIRKVISDKNFELKDILIKIDKIWLEKKLSDTERTELIDAARENADYKNSYDVDKQLEKICEKMVIIEERLNALENKEAIVEEYPVFIQPVGAHDAYNTDDKITYEGVKFICIIDNCVWGPDVYPQGWQKEEVT